MSDSDLVPLLDLPPAAAALKLRAAGEYDAAAAIETAFGAKPEAASFGFGLGSLLGLETNPWAYPVEVFGFVAPGADGDLVDVVDVARVTPQTDLRGARVNVTLQRVRTFGLPGGGEHTISFDFTTENALENATEEARYSVSTTANDGGFASIANFPMFRGLRIGSEGMSLRWRLINVKSADDERLLKLLNSDAVQTGLHLLATAQPALGLLSSATDGLAKFLNARDENAVVQDVRLGLDFSPNAFGARLACGSYVAVQASKSAWQDWKLWAYDARNGALVRRGGGSVPYNYVIVGIDRSSAA